MVSILIYLLKVSLIIALFFGVYKLFFRKTTFHQLNRTLLLLIIPFSLICPLLEFSGSPDPAMNNYSQWFSNFEQFSGVEVQDKSVNEGASAAVHPIKYLLLSIYFIGVLLFLIRFCIQLWSILKLKQSSWQTRQDHQVIYLTDDHRVPFSFFKWIFMPAGQNKNAAFQSMLTHEKVHASHWHSMDIMVYEFFSIVFWFNPFVWLSKKALKTVHEHIADEFVIRQTSSVEHYIDILLANISTSSSYGITNRFKSSTIKQRIEMITKTKNSRLRIFTYLFLLPLMALMIQAFAERPLDENNVPSIIPFENAGEYEMTSGYGMRWHPILKKKILHRGVDFKAKPLTLIIAPANGTVMKAERNGKSGNWIMIKHNSTFATTYSHLAKFNVEKGEKVNQGDVIGYVGNTGMSSAPHLHYEILKNSHPVNPEDYFE